MIEIVAMNYSARIVVSAIAELMDERDSITYEDIARHADMPLSTVRRAMKRLIENGAIERETPQQRGGSRYRINEVLNGNK